MKFNENIFYYLPRKSIKRGSFGSTLFIVTNSEKNNMFFVDPGTAAGDMGKILLNEIKKDNLNIKNIKGIFITHSHPDHISGINFFKQIIGDIPTYYNKNFLDSIRDPYYLKKKMLESLGSMKKEIAKMPSKIVETGFNYLYGKQTPVENLVGIKEGDIFYLDENENSFIEVLSAAGHTESHMAYLVHCSDNSKVLLSGDILSFKENGDHNLYALASLNNPLSSYEEELKTLDKLKNLEIDVLFTSHYGYYKGQQAVRNYIIEAKQRIEYFMDRVIEVLSKKPMNIADIAKKVITMKHYLSGYATKTSTIYSILKHLEKENKVGFDEKTRCFFLKR
ncbi:MAG: MBL fold metallo-hydrolase [Promethearchaeota archaeon]